MQTRFYRVLTGVMATTALALTGAMATGSPAAAAPEARAAVQAGRLILEPTERGYAGTLPVTVTNRGTRAESFDLKILEPIAGSFRDAGPDAPCLYENELTDGRRTVDCSPSLYLDAGQSRQALLTFEVLTTVRSFAMSAGPGTLAATVPGQEQPAGTDTFGTVFRSAKGNLKPTQPYAQDTQANAAITVGDATMTRGAYGRWYGRLPVTVRWDGDAAHDALWVGGATLPTGVQLWVTEPESGPADWLDHLEVPGGRFMPGEQRQFTLVVSAPGELSAAELAGTATIEVGAKFWPIDVLPEADASDNTATVQLTAVE